MSRPLFAWCLALAACGVREPAPTATLSPATSAPLPSSSTPTPVVEGDPEIAGTWYVDDDGARETFFFEADPTSGALGGHVELGNGEVALLDHATWLKAEARISAHVAGARPRWISAQVASNVLAGRVALEPEGATSEQPPPPLSFDRHLTGWHADLLSSIVPRTYELTMVPGGASDRAQHARLRLDRDPARAGSFQGRLKVYADQATGAGAEQDELDLEVLAWDGKTLRFATHDASERVFEASVSGRSLSGTFTSLIVSEGGAFSGERAEVLGYGLAPRSSVDRAAWQTRTRKALERLIMDGHPAPLGRDVTVLAEHLPPVVSKAMSVDRDDDPDSHPQAYERFELALDHALPDPLGGPPLHRVGHAFLFVPTTPRPAGGFPAVLALNGHTGSATRMTNPDDEKYWFGDGYARRGFVVLALDVSHRPLEDRHGLYSDFLMGDSPQGGNVAHPAIKSPGLDSSWEEDGERAWDAMRGLEYLRSRAEVDPSRVLVTGHSMGAEVTLYTAALDAKVPIAIASAPTEDFGVMAYYGNHPCWQWTYGDIREYLDMSDLVALVAPRELVLEVGETDFTYSPRPSPWACSKQIVRRGRAAYDADAEHLVEYLHYDRHHYHVGDLNPSKPAPRNVRVPKTLAPASPTDVAWQDDGATDDTGLTTFDLLEQNWP